MKFGDLRSILQYVPQFRDNTFVVALDGIVFESPDFSNILLDLAALRSLNIRVVLVHGAAAQIQALGDKRGVALSNIDGTGTTDEATLEVAMDAISRLGNSVMQSLTTVKIQAATANAIHAHPAGIIKGKDAGYTGTIERVDAKVLRSFLDEEILPVVPPLAFDTTGQTLRVNSDVVAREVAVALQASKIIFLSEDDPADCLEVGQRQLPRDAATDLLADKDFPLPPGVRSKMENAVKAVRDGVPRVHLVGAAQDDAILAELFSNEGVGVMVFDDDYLDVRTAEPGDVDELRLLIHRAVEEEQLLERSRSELLDRIQDFIVIVIDGNVVGCVALHPFPEQNVGELACLFVKKGHTGQGYGKLLVQAVLERARELGMREVFALSTQAAGYLEGAGFARSTELEKMPPGRREKCEQNGRNAILLVREIA